MEPLTWHLSLWNPTQERWERASLTVHHRGAEEIVELLINPVQQILCF
jgi:hypothetical protein